ncbi:heat-inducible transcriptional repressor HrcA [Alkaliphilus serpentinus]|uniref:Heat-inducible transcription repressor HrcA n=1 Tax=Alkaliphilus serpentinus TaxID=1482731 RepID=A0A833M7L8_9FIRM|nr:heat-inducible transcriptional repressor HrcA [Alkaliphilus serpentinus]KAB3530742.1 heat-inducible transcription repressor HrcA [Alkaliphilus serpentinus]
MELNERKLKILQAIIKDYIYTAEPVGSRTITKRYNLGVSPATIRNEMADLEELGYLMQPHTSAGRIPSDKAYRLYVDTLMEIKKIAEVQRDYIKANILRQFGELEQLLQYSSRVLAELTNYTTLALTPQLKGSRLKQLQLVPINNENLVAIIITDTGVVKKPLLRIKGGFDEEVIYNVSKVLNDKLAGSTLKDIEHKMSNDMDKEIFQFNNIINRVMPELFKTLEDINDFDLFLNGATNIFNFPEYSDIFKAKSFLTMLEEKQLLRSLIASSGGEGMVVSIGSENTCQEAKDCSLVTATFKLNGAPVGWLSLIGPTRMDYSNVISVMGQISKQINQLLKDEY